MQVTFVIFGHIALFPLADSWLKKQRLFGGSLEDFGTRLIVLNLFSSLSHVLAEVH